MIIWLTGPDASAVARALEYRLRHTTDPSMKVPYVFDHGWVGDWHRLAGDQAKQAARLAPVGQNARMLASTGLTVLVAEVVPSIAVREEEKRLCWEAGLRFLEVRVDSPRFLSERVERPAWYEPPDAPDVVVNAGRGVAEMNRAVDLIIDELRKDRG